MALADDAKADGLPEEVVAEIEGAQEGGGEEGGQDEAPVTFKLSRRKKEQQEREERVKAAEDRAARAEQLANEIRQQSATETAHLRGTLEQFQRQFQGFQQQANQPRQAQDEVPVEKRISNEIRAAEEALAKSDLREYHERMGHIMDLKAQVQAQAIFAKMPQPQAQAAPQAQKPAWVTAIEFQYPDVLSHPKGQQTVAIVDQLLGSEQWGPERLHKAFQRSRTELGLKPTAAPPSNGQRALYGSVNSTSVGGGRPSAGGEDKVSVKRSDLEMAKRFGMTAAQYAKAQKESFPNE